MLELSCSYAHASIIQTQKAFGMVGKRRAFTVKGEFGSDKLKKQRAKTYAMLLLSLLRLLKIQISKRVIILYTTGGKEHENNFLMLSGHLLMRTCAYMHECMRVYAYVVAREMG